MDLDEPTPEPLFEGHHFSPLPTTIDLTTEQIESRKDDQIISVKDNGCRQYLVHGKGRPESDDIWITRKDLQRLAPDLLEFYENHLKPYSTESSSFHPASTNGGITLVPLRTYQRRRHRITSTPFWL